jgi:hypothetical protein
VNERGILLVAGCWLIAVCVGENMPLIPTKKAFQFYVNQTGFFWTQKDEKI